MSNMSFSTTEVVVGGSILTLVVAGTTYYLASPSKEEREAFDAVSAFAKRHNIVDGKGNPDIAKAIQEINKANQAAAQLNPTVQAALEKKAQ